MLLFARRLGVRFGVQGYSGKAGSAAGRGSDLGRRQVASANAIRIIKCKTARIRLKAPAVGLNSRSGW